MCKFIVQIVFFGNKIVYKVLSSCGLSRTCNDIYSINKHISRILYDLFLFHRIHTYASVLRFPILHHYLCEIYHPGHTGSLQASNWRAPPPPYTASILHHHALVSVLTIHRVFPLKEALYFETCQIKLN